MISELGPGSSKSCTLSGGISDNRFPEGVFSAIVALYNEAKNTGALSLMSFTVMITIAEDEKKGVSLFTAVISSSYKATFSRSNIFSVTKFPS